MMVITVMMSPPALGSSFEKSAGVASPSRPLLSSLLLSFLALPPLFAPGRPGGCLARSPRSPRGVSGMVVPGWNHVFSSRVQATTYVRTFPNRACRAAPHRAKPCVFSRVQAAQKGASDHVVNPELKPQHQAQTRPTRPARPDAKKLQCKKLQCKKKCFSVGVVGAASPELP